MQLYRSYRRRLPHLDAVGQPVFVTFRLHDSLPSNRTFCAEQLSAGAVFVAMDRILDRAQTGPLYLRRPEIAEMVVAAVSDGERQFQRYELHSFVVMSNHVHLLVTPHVPAGRWLGPLKGFTAHQANQMLGSKGKPFWQDESYDRLVRTGAEFRKIQDYIENNPVRAGLVSDAGEFPWSSAYGRRGVGAVY